MYNIGGYQSSHSVMWCRLSSTYPAKWEFMDLLNYHFYGYFYREAFVVENKIVYFGSWNAKVTFVSEQEGESEQLKVVRTDGGFDLTRGYWNTASCVFKNKIYSFKTSNYEEVYRYSLESGKWKRFFKSDLSY